MVLSRTVLLGSIGLSNTDRVIFQKGKQRRLLVLAKQRAKCSWEDFAVKIGVSNYGVLRASYLSERNTLSLDMLRKITHYSDDLRWASWVEDIRDQHWGQAKGGSVSLKRWRARMRADPRSYHEMQSRRFRRSGNYKYMTSAGYEVRSLYELVVAENLVENRISHQYEHSLRCEGHVLFPDFSVPGGSQNTLIEVCGFRSKESLRRLRRKLRLYKSCEAAELLVVVHTDDRNLTRTIVEAFGHSVRLVSIHDMNNLISLVAGTSDSARPIRVIGQLDALNRCPRTEGKRFHWQSLLRTEPKERWVEILATAGLPEDEVNRARKRIEVDKRLIEAARIAVRNRLVPREALVEMIAGVYSGAVYTHFKSLKNLVAQAD
jgi:hypothetical protein